MSGRAVNTTSAVGKPDSPTPPNHRHPVSKTQASPATTPLCAPGDRLIRYQPRAGQNWRDLVLEQPGKPDRIESGRCAHRCPPTAGTTVASALWWCLYRHQPRHGIRPGTGGGLHWRDHVICQRFQRHGAAPAHPGHTRSHPGTGSPPVSPARAPARPWRRRRGQLYLARIGLGGASFDEQKNKGIRALQARPVTRYWPPKAVGVRSSACAATATSSS